MSEAICKAIEVPVGAARAFRAWTAEIGRWWPLDAHAVGRAVDCRIEGRPGGRVYEVAADGAEHLWGTVGVWAPPQRLVHSWHPGSAADDATTIEVRFAETAGGGCRIELIHGGWRDGDQARRAAYDEGWDGVLRDGYAAHLASGDRAGSPPG